MAESPAHKFGQIIGDLLENVMEPLFVEIAKKNGLFLDTRGERSARSGKKVSWKDKHENIHDLDFVFEVNGTDEKIGEPVAFIEPAWRRYTKHSRNKAQEIQGAILPLLETYRYTCRFIGVVIGGVFTEGAIKQLKSRGFEVLYFPYETVVKSFGVVGINARFDEHTDEEEFRIKIRKFSELTKEKKDKIKSVLIELNKDSVKKFIGALNSSLNRVITKIRIIALHGNPMFVSSVDDAIKYVNSYNEKNVGDKETFLKFEISIKYSNEDVLEATFKDKGTLVRFFKSL